MSGCYKVQCSKTMFLIFSVKKNSHSLGFYSLSKLFPNPMPLHSISHLISSLISLLALFEVHTWFVFQNTEKSYITLTTNQSPSYNHSILAVIRLFFGGECHFLNMLLLSLVLAEVYTQ